MKRILSIILLCPLPLNAMIWYHDSKSYHPSVTSVPEVTMEKTPLEKDVTIWASLIHEPQYSRDRIDFHAQEKLLLPKQKTLYIPANPNSYELASHATIKILDVTQHAATIQCILHYIHRKQWVCMGHLFPCFPKTFAGGEITSKVTVLMNQSTQISFGHSALPQLALSMESKSR